jgi:hypothetical protein
VLLLSLAAATPVVCLCMPTDQGYQSLRPEGIMPTTAAAQHQQREPQAARTAKRQRQGEMRQQVPAQPPVGTAFAALALIAAVVAPTANAALISAPLAPQRLLLPSLPPPSQAETAPPAPPPRESA